VSKTRLQCSPSACCSGHQLGQSFSRCTRAVATHWGAAALQGLHLFLGIYFAYVFTIVPALVASAILAWRTWRTGGFGYFAAALTACLCMLGYLGAAAFVFKNERVRHVDGDIALTAFGGVHEHNMHVAAPLGAPDQHKQRRPHLEQVD
jgi:hypothetical protein